MITGPAFMLLAIFVIGSLVYAPIYARRFGPRAVNATVVSCAVIAGSIGLWIVCYLTGLSPSGVFMAIPNDFKPLFGR